MGVSLSKGGNVSLSKEAPGLTAVIVGRGGSMMGAREAPLTPRHRLIRNDHALV